VRQLKKELAQKESGADATKVMLGDKELQDDATLEQNQIRDGATVSLLSGGAVKTKQIHVKTLKDRVFSISVDDSTDVAELKRRVEEQDPQWEVQRQRLIYQGSELRDQDLLSQCGLEENSPSVHLVMRLPQPGTSRSKKTKEEPSTVAKAARSTRSAVKAEPVDDSLDSAYETLGGSLAGRLDLSADDVLGDCSLPMELDQAWKEYSDEPALQSTGWESHMGNLGGSMDDVGVPQMDMTSPSSANSVPESATLMPIMMQQCGEEDSLSKTPSPFNSPVTAAPASPAKGTKQQQAVPATIVDGDVSSATPSTQGRAYDLTKVDDKLRKRLLKNRLSAERSRQRKQAHVETLEFELSCCRSENEALKKTGRLPGGTALPVLDWRRTTDPEGGLCHASRDCGAIIPTRLSVLSLEPGQLP
jgi:hypothetical protein